MSWQKSVPTFLRALLATATTFCGALLFAAYLPLAWGQVGTPECTNCEATYTPADQNQSFQWQVVAGDRRSLSETFTRSPGGDMGESIGVSLNKKLPGTTIFTPNVPSPGSQILADIFEPVRSFNQSRVDQEVMKTAAITPICGPGCGQSLAGSFAGFVPQSTAGLPVTSQGQNGERAASETNSEPVNPGTGEFYLQHVDLDIPAWGVPFVHQRTYRSRLTFKGPLGPGWDHSLNQKLVPVSNVGCDGQLVYSTGQGTAITFYPTTSNAATLNYGTLATFYSSLVASIQDGKIVGWQLDGGQGIVHHFDKNGLLESIQSAHGDSLSLSWTFSPAVNGWTLSSATDSVGRSYVYQYRSDGLLETVTESVSGLSASYSYNARGELETATDAYGYKERYVYDDEAEASASELALGDYVPAQGIKQACTNSCTGVQGNCGGANKCFAAIGSLETECKKTCTTCPETCSKRCTSGCGQSCETNCSTAAADVCSRAPALVRARELCDSAWDKAKGSCDRTHCLNSCGKSCNEGCDAILFCLGVNSDGEPTEGDTTQACQRAGNWSNNAEDLADLLAIGGAAIWDGLRCAWVDGLCFWCDSSCNVNNVREQVADYCNRPCQTCCALGEQCGKDSCNAGKTCDSECKRAFFDGESACGNAGTGCVDSLLGQCRGQATNECRKTCTGNCDGQCQQECSVGCGQCSSRCNLLKTYTGCGQPCIDTCVAQNQLRGPTVGPEYGHAGDLAHNITEVYDGTDRRLVKNVYGKDLSLPSFDAVVSHEVGDINNGGGTLVFHYRDLDLEPAQPSSVLDQYVVLKSAYEAVEICPACRGESDCDQQGLFRSAQRSKGTGPEGSIPARATVVRDPFGVAWTYYYDSSGREIRSVNHSNGATTSREYYRRSVSEPANLLGVELPLGNRVCLSYGFASLQLREFPVLVAQYPVPGEPAEQPLRVQRFEYGTVPAKLTAILDPRTPGMSKVLESFSWDANGSLRQTTGPAGVTTVVPNNHGLVETATNGAFLDRFEYRNGVLAKSTRDANGPSPVVTSLDPDRLGRPVDVLGPMGARVHIEWKGAHVEKQTKTSDGNTLIESLTYDGNGRVKDVDDGRMIVTTSYDEFGFPRTVKRSAKGTGTNGPAATVACYLHGPDGRILAMVEPEGNRTRFSYDGAGRLTGVTKGSIPMDSRSWDDECLPSSRLMPAEGTVLSVDYDLNGRVKSHVNASKQSALFSYAGYSEPATINNGASEVHQGFDAAGLMAWEALYPPFSVAYETHVSPAAEMLSFRQVSSTYPGRPDSETIWHFDSQGNPLAGGAVGRTYSYSGRKSITSIVNGRTDKTEFDGVGRPISRTWPNSLVSSTTYSNNGRTILDQWPAPSGLAEPVIRKRTTTLTESGLPKTLQLEGTAEMQTFDYDEFGRTTFVTRKGSASVSTTYDAFGRIETNTHQTSSGDEVTRFDWDGNDQLRHRERVGMPDSQWTYSTDSLGRVAKIRRPDGAEATTEYADYAAALPKSITSFGKKHRVFSYDPRGLLEYVTVYKPGSVESGDFDIAAQWHYSYDVAGRPAQATFSSTAPERRGSSVTSVWDSLGLLESETLEVDGHRFTSVHSYDSNLDRTLTELDGRTIRRSFDSLHRLVSASIGTEMSVYFSHVGSGLGGPQFRRDSNGLSASYLYDARSELKEVAVFKGVETLEGKGFVVPSAEATWQWHLGADDLPRAATRRLDGKSTAQASVYGRVPSRVEIWPRAQKCGNWAEIITKARQLQPDRFQAHLAAC